MVIALVVLVGCVPATTPAQLAYTPEAPVIVSDNVVDNGVFRARYPEGWEAVVGMDGIIVFSSPDGKYWVMLSAEGFDEKPTPPPGVEGDFALYSQGRSGLALPGTTTDVSVSMYAFIPQGEHETVQPIYDGIFGSIVLL